MPSVDYCANFASENLPNSKQSSEMIVCTHVGSALRTGQPLSNIYLYLSIFSFSSLFCQLNQLMSFLLADMLDIRESALAQPCGIQ